MSRADRARGRHIGRHEDDCRESDRRGAERGVVGRGVAGRGSRGRGLGRHGSDGRPRREGPSRRGSTLLRVLACVGLGIALILGSAGVAHALWYSRSSVTLPPIARGGVMFAVTDENDPTVRYSRSDGSAAGGVSLTVAVPGHDIADVPQTPLIWRFDVLGYAMGSAGMSFDVSYALPQDSGSGIHSIVEGSTVDVYPGGAGGDCSARPAPDPTTHHGLQTLSDQVLQPVGSNPSGTTITQPWCVAIIWKTQPSRSYTNVASVSAHIPGGGEAHAATVFAAMIDTPVALTPHASYHNTAIVQAITAAGLKIRDTDTFETALYPDPAKETDLTLTLTPHVVLA